MEHELHAALVGTEAGAGDDASAGSRRRLDRVTQQSDTGLCLARRSRPSGL